MWDRHPVNLSLVHMLPDVADRQGVALAPLLGRAGIGGELEPGRHVARAQIATLLEDFSRRAGAPGIGLDLAAGADPLRLGPSGQALLGGRTLRECLHAHTRHMPSLQGGVHIAIRETGGRACWQHAFADSDAGHAGVLNEGVAGFVVAALRAVAGEAGGDLHVELPHRARMPVRDYEDKLAAGVSFGNGVGITVSFDAAWLDRPNALFGTLPPPPEEGGTPPLVWSPRDDRALVETLDLIIAAAAMAGHLSLLDTARCLGLSPRSLQRQLARLGTTFEAQVEAWRHRQARRYLADRTLPVMSIGRMLGYRDPAHFVRAFRRWEGASPVRWREAMLARNGN
ncbi:AraC family transcriptional regulator ligand-binding domain-containing protein [Ancylobacter sp. WKF20]|uniref:helix-turn-helix transcriptional regulator n=1 Tax=Ancylobacter sp. WKF20 TaxID=3039801 RepID=UPI002434646B|nr:AraC family transcriptional regulator [Ancylobacter sp. WKF20]WGD30577.1 AraC family transcriptional regulator ligand-binding domain-containing protein [Ancylobacter sp. WKF20]